MEKKLKARGIEQALKIIIKRKFSTKNENINERHTTHIGKKVNPKYLTS